MVDGPLISLVIGNASQGGNIKVEQGKFVTWMLKLNFYFMWRVKLRTSIKKYERPGKRKPRTKQKTEHLKEAKPTTFISVSVYFPF